MTTFTETWNSAFKASPADTDQRSDGANKIRQLKNAITERMEVAHKWAGDADDGALLPAAVSAATGIVAGTSMVFYQAAAPTGWTKQTTINDRVLRVVSGSGGVTGGSWTISGLTNSATGSTTLTAAQSGVPAHLHPAPTGWSFMVGNGSEAASGPNGTYGYSQSNDQRARSVNTGNSTAQNASSGHAHGGSTISSSGAWRPSYADVIIASKN